MNINQNLADLIASRGFLTYHQFADAAGGGVSPEEGGQFLKRTPNSNI